MKASEDGNTGMEEGLKVLGRKRDGSEKVGKSKSRSSEAKRKM